MQISLWEKESFYSHRDIIIAGAGLAGLWCAYELKKKHPLLKILILEKNIIPTGASTRNAGFACFGSPSELLHDIITLGEDKVWETVEMRYKGIEKIRKILGDKIIDYDACGGYECFTKNLNDISNLKEKIQWLNSRLKKITGIEETFTNADKKLTALGLHGFDAMVENKLEGALHSGKLVMSLTRKVQNLGIDILTGVEIKSREENNNAIKIYTEQGIVFSADNLIVCTNAFTNKLIPGLNITPARGQIIVTSAIDNLKLKGTFHYDEGFYYFRNIGNRILLGGARNKAFKEEETTDAETSDTIQKELEKFLSTYILPSQKFSIEQRWSGIMGFTSDKNPFIKKISKNVTAVIVCNGMGVALSPVIAEKADAIVFG